MNLSNLKTGNCDGLAFTELLLGLLKSMFGSSSFLKLGMFVKEVNSIETCPLDVWRPIKKRATIGHNFIFDFWLHRSIWKGSQATTNICTRLNTFYHQIFFTTSNCWKCLDTTFNIVVVFTNGFWKEDLHRKVPPKLVKLVCTINLGKMVINNCNFWFLDVNVDVHNIFTLLINFIFVH